MIGRQRRGALLLTSALVGVTVFGLAGVANAKDSTYRFDIPAESLSQALTDFSQASQHQIIFSENVVHGHKISGLHGSYTVEQALHALLAGTDLEMQTNATGVLMVRQKKRQAASDEGATNPNAEIETVTVTGTHIRGAQVASSVVAITQEQIQQGGFNNLGEVARSIPENFSGGQNPELTGSGGPNTNQNISSGSAFNLRGLGPGATLTLLNGSRMSYDGPFEAVDVSSIPVAAIDHVEVLLDGASSVYGSDAVAGVANVVLKRDYDGAQLSARFGTSTDGGNEQTGYSALAGKVWDTGGFLIAGNASHNTSVSASQRDYLGNMPQGSQIYPAITQKSVLFTGHQEISPSMTFSIDGLFSDRHGQQVLVSTSKTIEQTGAQAWHIAPSLSLAVSDSWLLQFSADFNRDTTFYRNNFYSLTTDALTSIYHSKETNDSQSVGADAEGPLFALPGGDVRTSVGAGWRRANFHELDVGSQPADYAGDESSYFGYVEANFPFVSEGQHIPLVSSLTVDGAVRYEHYDNFGETTTPKLGAIWSVVPGLEVKASWGKSFKAPSLLQQYQPSVLYYLPSAAFAGGPANDTVMLQWGGNRNLKPERGDVVTAGIGITPDMVPGLDLDFGWSDVRYTDRVVQALVNYTTALVDPAAQQFVTPVPAAAQQNAAFAGAGAPVGSFFLNEGNLDYSPRPYNPADVYAIIDDRYINAASDHVSSIDISGHYVHDFLGGSLSLNGNASWFLDGTRKVTSAAPKTAITGVVYYAPNFKGRLAVSWSRGGLTISSALNHTGGVTNNLFTPEEHVSSMTTVDLVGNYDFDSGAMNGVSLNLAIGNIFNTAPPYMKREYSWRAAYDATNYSALGRTINLSVTKRF